MRKKSLTEAGRELKATKAAGKADEAVFDVADGPQDDSYGTRGPSTFPTVKEAFAYLKECGRKIAKTKFYDDLRRGYVPKRKEGFRRSDLDRYALTLPMTETPQYKIDDFEERAATKDELQIRNLEIDNATKSLKLSILSGKHVARDVVDQELAARAVTLNSGLKSEFEARAGDIIASVGGDTALAGQFLRAAEQIIDEACGRYAADMEIEVVLDEDGEAYAGDGATEA